MLSEPIISIVLPTRGRASLVGRLLDSILDTAARPDLLQVVLYLDRDDGPSHAIEHSRLELVKLVGPAAKMGQMTRACWQAGSGRYVLLLNDDVVCRTPAWDARVVAPFAELPDGVALVWCNDLFRGPIMPSFPLLSRRTCELMGGVCPPDYNRDYIDTHLFDIFKKLEALGHRRTVYLEDVVLEHLHHEAGKAEFDATYVKAGREADELTYIAWDQQRQIVAERLARHIERQGQCDS